MHLLAVYRRLYGRYGPQHWWPGDDPLETIVGAILTQNTAWGNVDKALSNLKAANALSMERIRELPQEELASLIRPSGYFNTKARKLRAFAQHLWERYDDDLGKFLGRDMETLRRELLSIYGIGDETADDIVLYAAHKPSFVIDAYTRRIMLRLGVVPERDRYSAFQALFHEHLDRDTQLFNEYHALLARHAKETCRKRPLCGACCLLSVCPTGSRWLAHQRSDQSQPKSS
ncbi:MAG: endonuclease [Chloroflexi bacterium]|nr:endonuclease [Chloroflexota bacterium]